MALGKGNSGIFLPVLPPDLCDFSMSLIPITTAYRSSTKMATLYHNVKGTMALGKGNSGYPAGVAADLTVSSMSLIPITTAYRSSTKMATL